MSWGGDHGYGGNVTRGLHTLTVFCTVHTSIVHATQLHQLLYSDMPSMAFHCCGRLLHHCNLAATPVRLNGCYAMRSMDPPCHCVLESDAPELLAAASAALNT